MARLDLSDSPTAEVRDDDSVEVGAVPLQGVGSDAARCSSCEALDPSGRVVRERDSRRDAVFAARDIRAQFGLQHACLRECASRTLSLRAVWLAVANEIAVTPPVDALSARLDELARIS